MKLGVLMIVAACSAQPSKLDELAAKAPPDASDLPATIDAIANDALSDTKVPSAQVAVVMDGKLLYAHAYGDARLEPKTAATQQMRYSIGSISKQFTATAILMLVEEGKLKLDDKVATYVPGLTRGDEVTIRQLLSHTSGYSDYAPQDYMIPEWEQPISRAAIMDRWAKQPLDFDPGTRWQYSNTNFVIAGAIFERVAGQPLFDALKARVFDKLGMSSVTNTDLAKLTAADAQGYFRRANGPAHEAPHEGPGWMYAAGELAMTAEDLAKWDISVIDKTILTPASYAEMETEIHLANSIGTRYGLGISVSMPGGHRELEHSGEVSGFVSDNVVYPDDGIAVAVLTNQDASGAASTIADGIANALLAVKTRSVAADDHVKQLVEGFARGELDRALMTANANAYFTAEAIDEYKQAIVAAGHVEKVTQDRAGKRGGMTGRRYTVKCASKSLSISVYEMPDGKFEQFLIE